MLTSKQPVYRSAMTLLRFHCNSCGTDFYNRMKGHKKTFKCSSNHMWDENQSPELIRCKRIMEICFGVSFDDDILIDNNIWRGQQTVFAFGYNHKLKIAFIHEGHIDTQIIAAVHKLCASLSIRLFSFPRYVIDSTAICEFILRKVLPEESSEQINAKIEGDIKLRMGVQRKNKILFWPVDSQFRDIDTLKPEDRALMGPPEFISTRLDFQIKESTDWEELAKSAPSDEGKKHRALKKQQALESNRKNTIDAKRADRQRIPKAFIRQKIEETRTRRRMTKAQMVEFLEWKAQQSSMSPDSKPFTPAQKIINVQSEIVEVPIATTSQGPSEYSCLPDHSATIKPTEEIPLVEA